MIAGRAAALLIVSGLLVSAGCAGKRDVGGGELLSAEEMYSRAQRLQEQNKNRAAITMLEKIDLRYTGRNRSKLEPLVRLALADATFYQHTTITLIDSRQMYLDFVTFFGDHRLAPYAQFQAGVCSLEQVNHPSRDQSQTLAAFTDLREVVRRYPASRYASAARDMIRRAQGNLAEHEYLVGRFYFKKKVYGAAANRFRGLLDSYPDFEQRDKVYFHLGQTLVLNDQDVEGRIYLDMLIADFPDGKFAEEARKLLADAGGGHELTVQGSPD